MLNATNSTNGETERHINMGSSENLSLTALTGIRVHDNKKSKNSCRTP